MNHAAEVLPEGPPRVGELVEVRSRRWLVEAVDAGVPPASPLVSLACADVASWHTRLAQFDRDLETEPARVREFYEVLAKRVEPIGLVYLWPDTG